MNYTELNIPVGDAQQAEILTAELADFPFDSFCTEDNALKAYIASESLSGCRQEVDAMLDTYNIKGATYTEIQDRDWNREWETEIAPVEVEDKVFIHTPEHAPSADAEYDIVITPQMSFGTGHHATTWLMCREITSCELQGKRILDMGSGTGVLSILAAKRGAATVDAVDIDEWAYRNCIDNTSANGVRSTVTSLLGDVAVIKGRRYDLIFANINRNILLRDMDSYVECLEAGGKLLMSGFLAPDVELICQKAESLGLSVTGKNQKEDWWEVTTTRAK